MKKSLYCFALLSLVFNIKSMDFEKNELKKFEEAITAARKIIESNEFQEFSANDKSNIKNYFINGYKFEINLIAGRERIAQILAYDQIEFRKRIESQNALNMIDRLEEIVNDKDNLFKKRFYESIIALLTPEKPHVT